MVQPSGNPTPSDAVLSVMMCVGTARMQVRAVEDLAVGSVVAFEKLSGEPLNLMFGGKIVGHGRPFDFGRGNIGVLVESILPAET